MPAEKIPTENDLAVREMLEIVKREGRFSLTVDSQIEGWTVKNAWQGFKERWPGEGAENITFSMRKNPKGKMDIELVPAKAATLIRAAIAKKEAGQEGPIVDWEAALSKEFDRAKAELEAEKGSS